MPHLFADDGTGMKFVKDCAPWSPALGLRINAQDTMGILQTEEWMKIRGDQLKPRDGFYDLRITAELWETFYIDHYTLMVVDHPAGTEVFRRRVSPCPRAARCLYGSSAAPLRSSADDLGEDVSEIVGTLRHTLLGHVRAWHTSGSARDHYVELELGNAAPAAALCG